MTADLEMVRAFLSAGSVPFNKVLGIEIVAVEDERAEARMPASPDRFNHVGTAHAAAQFGLGEGASAAMALGAFASLLEGGAIPLVAEAQIAYRKPAAGDLRGVATLTRAEQERALADWESAGKMRVSVPVQLLDEQGVVTTEMSVTWVLLRPRGA